MTKQEIAVEILRLCAQDIVLLERKTNAKPDFAGRLAQAYNAIYAAINDPQGGE